MGQMNDLFVVQDAAQDVHQHITLGSATDLAGFRRAARSLLARRITPAQVMWHVALNSSVDVSGQVQDLFAGSDDMPALSLVSTRTDTTAIAPASLPKGAAVDTEAASHPSISRPAMPGLRLLSACRPIFWHCVKA